MTQRAEKMAYICPWGLAENMAYTYARGPAYKTQNTSRWEGVPMQAKHKNTGRWEGVKPRLSHFQVYLAANKCGPVLILQHFQNCTNRVDLGFLREL
jgi:hypothetical protein